MIAFRRFPVSIVVVFWGALAGAGVRSGAGAVSARAANAGAAAALLRVRGADIVDGAGRRVVLRGVSFGNQVWGNVRLPRRHHGEVDYQRVAAMGMNAVRFYMDFRTFESDAAPGQYLADGWQWLDDNIAWARKMDARGEDPARRDLPDPPRFLRRARPVQASDKAFLAQELDAYVDWGRRHHVPRQRGLSFTYHAYHEDSFGIYRGSGAAPPDPAQANDPLIALFTTKMRTPGGVPKPTTLGGAPTASPSAGTPPPSSAAPRR